MKRFAIIILMVLILSACTSKAADSLQEDTAAADTQEANQKKQKVEEDLAPKEAAADIQTQKVAAEKEELQNEEIKPSPLEKVEKEVEASNLLTHEQAEDLVRKFLNLEGNSNVHVKYDHDAENGDYIIQVYEVIIDDPKTGEGHTSTWGWYGVNKDTKNVYDTMN